MSRKSVQLYNCTIVQLLKSLLNTHFAGCFLANLCIINLEGMENAVFGLSLTAKGMSNIAWFIMWVQSIEVGNLFSLFPELLYPL